MTQKQYIARLKEQARSLRQIAQGGHGDFSTLLMRRLYATENRFAKLAMRVEATAEDEKKKFAS